MQSGIFRAAILALLLAVWACDSSSLLSPANWSARYTAQKLIKEAELEANSGHPELAVGKYRKAYRLRPEEKEIPLRIAKLFGKIYQDNPQNAYARTEAIHWLYRASLADPEFDPKVIRQNEFSALRETPEIQALLSRYGLSEGKLEMMRVLQVLDRMQASLMEVRDISIGIGRVVGALYRAANFIGFQVTAFLFLVFVIATLLRVAGFFYTRGVWVMAFAVTGLIWHWGARIASGGVESGWQTIGQLTAWSAGVFLLLTLLKHGMFRLGTYCMRKLRRPQDVQIEELLLAVEDLKQKIQLLAQDR